MMRSETAFPGIREEREEKSFYFQWHFLAKCNLRCVHCYQSDYRSPALPENTLYSIFASLVEALDRWQCLGRISLTGGEPFLDSKALFMLLDWIERAPRFYRAGILTNGTLVTPEICMRLKSYAKLREVQVSLDGAEEKTHDLIRGHGSFKMAIKGITYLRQAGIPVTIMFTCTKQNLRDSLKVIDLADNLGVNAITIERVVSHSANVALDALDVQNIYNTIAKKKEEISHRSSLKIRTSRPLWCLVASELGGMCPAGFSSLTILHDGTVLACRRLETPLGNILEDGIFRIWYTSPVLWKLRNRSLLPRDCKECKFLSDCGGCRAMAYVASGDFMAKDPHCWKNRGEMAGG